MQADEGGDDARVQSSSSSRGRVADRNSSPASLTGPGYPYGEIASTQVGVRNAAQVSEAATRVPPPRTVRRPACHRRARRRSVRTPGGGTVVVDPGSVCRPDRSSGSRGGSGHLSPRPLERRPGRHSRSARDLHNGTRLAEVHTLCPTGTMSPYGRPMPTECWRSMWRRLPRLDEVTSSGARRARGVHERRQRGAAVLDGPVADRAVPPVEGAAFRRQEGVDRGQPGRAEPAGERSIRARPRRTAGGAGRLADGEVGSDQSGPRGRRPGYDLGNAR